MRGTGLLLVRVGTPRRPRCLQGFGCILVAGDNDSFRTSPKRKRGNDLPPSLALRASVTRDREKYNSIIEPESSGAPDEPTAASSARSAGPAEGRYDGLAGDAGLDRPAGDAAQDGRQAEPLAGRGPGPGIAILLAALGGIYRSAVGSYAVVDGLSVTRDPASQGRIGIRFDVRVPGKVVYHRTSGKIETEVGRRLQQDGPRPAMVELGL